MTTRRKYRRRLSAVDLTRIRTLRTQDELPIREIAQRIGCSHTAVRNVCARLKIPAPDLRRRPTLWKRIDQHQFTRLWGDTSMSLQALSRTIGISKDTCYEAARRFGLKPRHSRQSLVVKQHAIVRCDGCLGQYPVDLDDPCPCPYCHAMLEVG